MPFKVINIEFVEVQGSLEKTLKNGIVKFDTIRGTFNNCICSWELNAGELYICEVKCHFQDAESVRLWEVDYTNLQYERTYIPTFIEDDNKVKLNWEYAEFIFPDEILKDHRNCVESAVMTFENGNLSKLRWKVIYYEPLDDLPF